MVKLICPIYTTSNSDCKYIFVSHKVSSFINVVDRMHNKNYNDIIEEALTLEK